MDDKGIIPLSVNKEKHLPFDTSDAGPGECKMKTETINLSFDVTAVRGVNQHRDEVAVY